MEGSEVDASAEESEEEESGTETEEEDKFEEGGAAIEKSEVDVEMKDEASVVVDNGDDGDDEALLKTRHLSPEMEYPSPETCFCLPQDNRAKRAMMML